MSLDDWDRNVRPHLQFISAGAEMSARHARLLLAKPDFETLAGDDLRKVRMTLETALACVTAAEAIMEAKPHAA